MIVKFRKKLNTILRTTGIAALCVLGTLFFVPMILSWLLPKEAHSQIIAENISVRPVTINTKLTKQQTKDTIRAAALANRPVTIDISKLGISYATLQQYYIEILQKADRDIIYIGEPGNFNERLRLTR